MAGNDDDDDWIKQMNEQELAEQELASNVPPNADDLRNTAVDPRQAEISLIEESTARRNEFNVLMRKLFI